MKILFIGFLAFVAWTTFATYIYVCKIRGLCNEPATEQLIVANLPDTASIGTIPALAPMPANLVSYFDFDKSDFAADSNSEKFFNYSRIFLNQNLQKKLIITGHADAVGSNEYNMALGLRRAKTMQLYFESKGLLPNKIDIVTKGENQPADNNNTEAGRANNRRTEITIK